MAKGQNKNEEQQYVIVSGFRDKSNFNIEYKAGQPAIFEADRLAQLIQLGLVATA